MANKSREKRNREYDAEFVPLDEVYVPERTIDRIMRKDHGQIEKMRGEFECGRDFVRVVLRRRRCGGGYNVEDGRHRVIAAKLACESFIEAIIVGN